jgi:hypothetical protein
MAGFGIFGLHDRVPHAANGIVLAALATLPARRKESLYYTRNVTSPALPSQETLQVVVARSERSDLARSAHQTTIWNGAVHCIAAGERKP